VIVAALAAALRLATMPRVEESRREQPLAIVYNPRLVPQQQEQEQPRLVGHKSPHTDVWGYG
jgi:hypothetical protein